MKLTTCLVSALALLFLVASSPLRAAEVPVRRFALVLGINNGGPDRVQLRYAASDARAFSRVLTELGGVAASDQVLVLDGGRPQVQEGMGKIEKLLATATDRQRVELVFYYSGHSDEQGLLLSGERLPYAELKKALGRLKADVQIAILDSCASGAMTRLKGGTFHAPFLFDRSVEVSGYAYLTSSSADEAAQESDRIGGSFFTHYLVSGLRGAADASLDRRVTLGEAYQFAFHETLARTRQTAAGPQHPAYDMQLSGTGDLVMTDLRGTSAGLVLSEGIKGRLFIYDGGQLAVEAAAVGGRSVELGLAPGTYDILLVNGSVRLSGRVTLVAGKRTTLSLADLSPAPQELTALRGDEPLLEVAAPQPPGEPGAREYAVVPVSISVVPALALGPHRGLPTQKIFALGIIGDGADRVTGLQISSAFNIVREDVAGAQIAGAVDVVGQHLLGLQIAGAAAITRGQVDGVQSAGAFNVAGGDARVIQSSGGFNLVGGQLVGAQFTGGVNVAGQLTRGVQSAGGGNLALGDLQGLQIAGGVNVARHEAAGIQLAGGLNVVGGQVVGAQIVGGVNVAQAIHGAQIGVVNVALGPVSGAQIGVVNVAGEVKGAQIGVVNVARSVEGLPLGVVSVVRDGQRHLELTVDESAVVRAQAKLGNHTFYNVFAAGLSLTDPEKLYFGMGLGVHAPVGRLYLDVDVMGQTVERYEGFGQGMGLSGLSTGRVALGWQITPELRVFGGPTLNLAHIVGDEEVDFVPSNIPLLLDTTVGNVDLAMWPGLFVGIGM